MDDNTLEGVIASTEIWTPLSTTEFSRIAIGNAEDVTFLEVFYKMIEAEDFPSRKDDQDHLIHPLTVTHFLQKAKTPFLDQAAGMLHDYIEELVDDSAEIFGFEMPRDVELLGGLEEQLLWGLREDLVDLFPKRGVYNGMADKLIGVVDLVTRHKRENYYRSISRIFACTDPEIRGAAIRVKLADRIHAAGSLQPFDVRGKIYQCFKNLFILNNTKRYLIETGKITSGSSEETMDPTEKLFRKCCKATYVAFWEILSGTRDKKVVPTLPVMHLAFQKYAQQYEGLGTVTDFDPNEDHPLWLSQAIVKKYDAWLHKEDGEFKMREKREKDYCQNYFKDHKFGKKQIESLIFYKDAFALKEVIVRLLYQPQYEINGFGCSAMCSRSNVCSLDTCKS